jgi:predicted ATP-grasp superfamily ATP-dependent carboligase
MFIATKFAVQGQIRLPTSVEPNKIDKVSECSLENSHFGGINTCLAIGYSARALSEALRDLGLSVIAADAFGDYDTLETAKEAQIILGWGEESSASGLLAALVPASRSLPRPARLPVFLGGGCENWPSLIRHLEKTAWVNLLGPNSQQLSNLRNPLAWSAAVQGTEIGFPPSDFSQVVQNAGFEPTRPGAQRATDLRVGGNQDSNYSAQDAHVWLLKSAFSSGGLGVSLAPPAACQTVASRQDMITSQNVSQPGQPLFYRQRLIQGRTLGACLQVCRPAGETAIKLIAVTEAWSASQWPGPTPFIYRGSWGPIGLGPRQQEELVTLALNLIRSAAPDYVGWLQFDLIEDSHQRLWLIEVNPRWTAGMEVLLRSRTANMAALHAQAFGIDLNPGWMPKEIATGNERQQQSRADACCVGKAIYYAPHDIRLTSRIVSSLQALWGQGFADLPHNRLIGTTISAGHPVLTLLADVPNTRSHNDSPLAEILLAELHRKRQLIEHLTRVDLG